jgi:hypothetical protein
MVTGISKLQFVWSLVSANCSLYGHWYQQTAVCMVTGISKLPFVWSLVSANCSLHCQLLLYAAVRKLTIEH